MTSFEWLAFVIKSHEKNWQKFDQIRTWEPSQLMVRPREGSWNALECLEHLNRYGDFYLPKIAWSLEHKAFAADADFKSGWLGVYFSKMILPGGSASMKTAPMMTPTEALVPGTVLKRFEDQHNTLQQLMDRSARVSLNRIRIQTSLSPLIRLKLGDVFHFLINHNLRHLHQIDSIQKGQ